MIGRRRLGRTGLDVSELTIGTSRLAAAPTEQALSALALAFAAGIDAVEIESGDAAAAERLCAAQARAGTGRSLHVFARARSLVRFDLPSPHVHAQAAYPGAHIRAETEALLKRLGVERLAVQQIHAWCPEWLGEGDWLDTLGRLRDEGKIAGIGISLFDHDVDAGLAAVASGAIDCVQVMVNLFDPSAAATLLPLCARHGVGVIARSPLYYGALSTRIDASAPFAEDDWRRDYFYDAHLAETRARVARLAADVASPERSVADLALRFALAHPAVTTVAVGMHSLGQVEANLAAIARGPLPPERAAALRAHRWLC